MTRNQKIALGCGGAGCLGLIVVAIAGSLIYFFVMRPAAYRAANRNYNFNVNLNRNSNSNNVANENSADSNSNSSSSAASMSDDDKHKLYHAATVTGDSDLVNRVSVKIGIMNDDLTVKDDYQQFMVDHATWAFRNLAFLREIGTREKAQAYVDEHLE
ncbi:MAG TPA: hypothetical protein VM941_00020 [Pyrinomonadaceae bacterium]|jgi:hypothetical protein|nr:hypothetical protein [Pyrinomonadaceae bacterium]